MRIRNILMAIVIGMAGAFIAIPAEAKGSAITVRLMVDCEDTETITVPCVTFDEGQWRMVKSYSPYKYKKLGKCKAFHRKAPCVYTKKLKSGKYRVVLKK